MRVSITYVCMDPTNPNTHSACILSFFSNHCNVGNTRFLSCDHDKIIFREKITMHLTTCMIQLDLNISTCATHRLTTNMSNPILHLICCHTVYYISLKSIEL